MKKLEVLECIRGLAAIYVFSGHFLLHHFFKKEGLVGFFFRFGQEAVMLFFLLSGFVIYYSSQKHQESFSAYFVRRFRRIYPIFLIALLVTYLSASATRGGLASLRVGELVGNLVMLQDFGGGKPGVWVPAYYGNFALWSLSYEWWFYMAFYPLTHRVKTTNQLAVVTTLALVGFFTFWLFPNQISLFLMYFIVWWTGVEMARLYCAGIRPTIKTAWVPLALLGCLCLLQVLGMVAWSKLLHRGSLSFGIHPVLEARHFLFALITLLMALTLGKKAWAFLGSALRPFGIFAPISYALYVLHFPLSVSATYLDGVVLASLQPFLYLMIAFGAAWLCEIPLQRLVNRWVHIPDSKRGNAPHPIM